jgi:hypothetical protein
MADGPRACNPIELGRHMSAGADDLQELVGYGTQGEPC